MANVKNVSQAKAVQQELVARTHPVPLRHVAQNYAFQFLFFRLSSKSFEKIPAFLCNIVTLYRKLSSMHLWFQVAKLGPASVMLALKWA